MDQVTASDGRAVPDAMDVRVHLVGGSPLLSVSDRPVAWFENWVRADRAALTVLAEMRGVRQ